MYVRSPPGRNTLTRWGRVLHGPYAIARSTLQAARLQPACLWWPWLLGRLPRAQVELVVSPHRTSITVRVLDVTTAAVVVHALGHTTPAPRASASTGQPTDTPGEGAEHTAATMALKPVSAIKALLFSAMLPGAGQFLEDRLGAGIFYLVITWYYMMHIMGPVRDLVLRTRDINERQLLALLVTLACLWGMNLMDAYRYARQAQTVAAQEPPAHW